LFLFEAAKSGKNARNSLVKIAEALGEPENKAL